VPSTFRLNERQSGLRTIAQDSASYPALKTRYASWGHLAGFQIRFDQGDRSIVSRADVLRGRAGARGMFAWCVGEIRRQGVRSLRPTALTIGDEGAAYTLSDGGIRVTVVAWRFGRVFSVVGGDGVARARVLALARTQQQRVARAFS
jgi:hypothetical protein